MFGSLAHSLTHHRHLTTSNSPAPATYAPGYAFLVDPADPPLVLAHLQSLPTPPIITHILTTHKHWDHAGGNLKIVETLNPTQVRKGRTEGAGEGEEVKGR